MEHMVPMEGHIYDMFPRKILGSKLYSVQTAIRREVKNSKNAVSLSLRAILWVLPSCNSLGFVPTWRKFSTMMICHQFLRFYNVFLQHFQTRKWKDEAEPLWIESLKLPGKDNSHPGLRRHQ
jgi:hypothetical protein